ncbi:MAG: helix-turn-helix transcriptional regulator [Actinomycetota bacterium]
MEKTERHLNLIALLMDARLPVSRDRIRQALYSDQTEEAFSRMFERDKAELRDLGLAVEVVDMGAWDQGYVIRREDVTIGDLDFTPAEHAALMLAAQMWGEGTFGQASPSLAGAKLAASTAEMAPVPWILPHVALRSPNVTAITNAIEQKRAISFLYRASGKVQSSRRTIEPIGIRFRRAWYVAGLDRERGDARMFKLDRIEGSIELVAGPEGEFTYEGDYVFDWSLPASEDLNARIAVTQDIAWWVERSSGVRRIGIMPDERVEIEANVPDSARFVRWVLGFADSAEILEPAELRDEIVRTLGQFVEQR